MLLLSPFWDFPGGPVVKNPPSKAEYTCSIPDPGRFHMTWGNSYWAHSLEPESCNRWSHDSSRAHALQQEKPPQGEASAGQN